MPFSLALIAGGCAGTTVDVALFPLDTLKTRLQAEGGFWKVEADTDEGVPTYVQWRLGCAGGLAASGQQLVPAGPLYFNAKARASDGGDRLALVDGRITIKEDVGANTPLFAGRGILAEFKVVGTFEAREAQGGPEG